MSSMKKPVDADQLDQTKAYHVVPHEENWSQGVVCGVLHNTGEVAHYGYFDCWVLQCEKCGKETDISNYDSLYVGNKSSLGETI